MSIKLVIFDMAGTTVQDNNDVAIALISALNSLGYSVTVEDVNVVMGLPKPEAIELLIHLKTGVFPSSDTVDSVYLIFEQKMIEHYLNHPDIKEIEGTSATFRQLREKEVKIGIDTGFSRVIADTIMQRLGWQNDGLIDVSVTSDEVAHGRPSPDMIFRAMELCGINDAGDVAKVGDTISDMKEGTSAGCRYVIGLPGKANSFSDLMQAPHTHIINYITEVPHIILQ